MTDAEYEKLMQWVREKQLILDRLLAENSSNYQKTHQEFSDEYARLCREVKDREDSSNE